MCAPNTPAAAAASADAPLTFADRVNGVMDHPLAAKQLQKLGPYGVKLTSLIGNTAKVVDPYAAYAEKFYQQARAEGVKQTVKAVVKDDVTPIVTTVYADTKKVVDERVADTKKVVEEKVQPYAEKVQPYAKALGDLYNKAREDGVKETVTPIVVQRVEPVTKVLQERYNEATLYVEVKAEPVRVLVGQRLKEANDTFEGIKQDKRLERALAGLSNLKTHTKERVQELSANSVDLIQYDAIMSLPIVAVPYEHAKVIVLDGAQYLKTSDLPTVKSDLHKLSAQAVQLSTQAVNTSVCYLRTHDLQTIRGDARTLCVSAISLGKEQLSALASAIQEARSPKRSLQPTPEEAAPEEPKEEEVAELAASVATDSAAEEDFVDAEDHDDSAEPEAAAEEEVEVPKEGSFEALELKAQKLASEVAEEPVDMI